MARGLMHGSSASGLYPDGRGLDLRHVSLTSSAAAALRLEGDTNTCPRVLSWALEKTTEEQKRPSKSWHRGASQ